MDERVLEIEEGYLRKERNKEHSSQFSGRRQLYPQPLLTVSAFAGIFLI